jgi:hypothetical protein
MSFSIIEVRNTKRDIYATDSFEDVYEEAAAITACSFRPYTSQYCIRSTHTHKETDLEELLHKRALGLHLRLEQDPHNMRLLFQQ